MTAMNMVRAGILLLGATLSNPAAGADSRDGGALSAPSEGTAEPDLGGAAASASIPAPAALPTAAPTAPAAVPAPPSLASEPGYEATDAGAAKRTAMGEPSLSSKVAPPTTGVVMSATESSTLAQAQLAKGISIGESLNLYLGVGVSAPVTSQTQTATLASLDGLASTANAQARLSVVYWSVDPPNAEKQKAVCEYYLHKNGCARSELPEGRARSAYDGAVNYGHPLFATIVGQVGHPTFKYLSPSTLTLTSETETPAAVTAGLGVEQPGLGYLGASYSYQVAYTAGSQDTVCRPSSVAGTSLCQSQVVGAPTQSASSILTGEARLFTRFFSANPMVSFDANKDVWGLQLPLYFIPSTSGPTFIGGINPGWTSDTHAFTAVLFVGAPLSLVPGFIGD